MYIAIVLINVAKHWWRTLLEYNSIYLSIYLSFTLTIYLSLYLSITLSIYLYINQSLYLSIHLSIFYPNYLSITIFINHSIYLSINHSFYLSIYLWIYLFIDLNIYISLYLSFTLSLYLSFILIYSRGQWRCVSSSRVWRSYYCRARDSSQRYVGLSAQEKGRPCGFECKGWFRCNVRPFEYSGGLDLFIDIYVCLRWYMNVPLKGGQTLSRDKYPPEFVILGLIYVYIYPTTYKKVS